MKFDANSLKTNFSEAEKLLLSYYFLFLSYSVILLIAFKEEVSGSGMFYGHVSHGNEFLVAIWQMNRVPIDVAIFFVPITILTCIGISKNEIRIIPILLLLFFLIIKYEYNPHHLIINGVDKGERLISTIVFFWVDQLCFIVLIHYLVLNLLFTKAEPKFQLV